MHLVCPQTRHILLSTEKDTLQLTKVFQVRSFPQEGR